MQFVLKQEWGTIFKYTYFPVFWIYYAVKVKCIAITMQELWLMSVTFFPLCSSQIMSPVPPVSSPPLTSKTKELADNENLDVSQILYLHFLYLRLFSDLVLVLLYVCGYLNLSTRSCWILKVLKEYKCKLNAKKIAIGHLFMYLVPLSKIGGLGLEFFIELLYFKRKLLQRLLHAD